MVIYKNANNKYYKVFYILMGAVDCLKFILLSLGNQYFDKYKIQNQYFIRIKCDKSGVFLKNFSIF